MQALPLQLELINPSKFWIECEKRWNRWCEETGCTLRMKTCATCGATAGNICSRCHGIMYCSRECQKKHYPIHKSKCLGAPNLEDALYKAIVNVGDSIVDMILNDGTRYSLGETADNKESNSKDVGNPNGHEGKDTKKPHREPKRKPGYEEMERKLKLEKQETMRKRKTRMEQQFAEHRGLDILETVDPNRNPTLKDFIQTGTFQGTLESAKGFVDGMSMSDNQMDAMVKDRDTTMQFINDSEKATTLATKMAEFDIQDEQDPIPLLDLMESTCGWISSLWHGSLKDISSGYFVQATNIISSSIQYVLYGIRIVKQVLTSAVSRIATGVLSIAGGGLSLLKKFAIKYLMPILVPIRDFIVSFARKTYDMAISIAGRIVNNIIIPCMKTAYETATLQVDNENVATIWATILRIVFLCCNTIFQLSSIADKVNENIEAMFYSVTDSVKRSFSWLFGGSAEQAYAEISEPPEELTKNVNPAELGTEHVSTWSKLFEWCSWFLRGCWTVLTFLFIRLPHFLTTFLPKLLLSRIFNWWPSSSSAEYAVYAVIESNIKILNAEEHTKSVAHTLEQLLNRYLEDKSDIIRAMHQHKISLSFQTLLRGIDNCSSAIGWFLVSLKANKESQEKYLQHVKKYASDDDVKAVYYDSYYSEKLVKLTRDLASEADDILSSFIQLPVSATGVTTTGTTAATTTAAEGITPMETAIGDPFTEELNARLTEIGIDGDILKELAQLSIDLDKIKTGEGPVIGKDEVLRMNQRYSTISDGFRKYLESKRSKYTLESMLELQVMILLQMEATLPRDPTVDIPVPPTTKKYPTEIPATSKKAKDIVSRIKKHKKVKQVPTTIIKSAKQAYEYKDPPKMPIYVQECISALSSILVLVVSYFINNQQTNYLTNKELKKLKDEEYSALSLAKALYVLSKVDKDKESVPEPVPEPVPAPVPTPVPTSVPSPAPPPAPVTAPAPVPEASIKLTPPETQSTWAWLFGRSTNIAKPTEEKPEVTSPKNVLYNSMYYEKAEESWDKGLLTIYTEEELKTAKNSYLNLDEKVTIKEVIDFSSSIEGKTYILNNDSKITAFALSVDRPGNDMMYQGLRTAYIRGTTSWGMSSKDTIDSMNSYVHSDILGKVNLEDVLARITKEVLGIQEIGHRLMENLIPDYRNSKFFTTYRMVMQVAQFGIIFAMVHAFINYIMNKKYIQAMAMCVTSLVFFMAAGVGVPLFFGHTIEVLIYLFNCIGKIQTTAYVTTMAGIIATGGIYIWSIIHWIL